MILNSFIKSAIEREDNLFARIYRFNEMVSEYIEESHLEFMPSLEKYWKNLSVVARVQKKLSLFLLKHFKLEGKPFYQFEDPRLRIALLDSKVLNDLLVYAGAVFYSERISKLILKKDVTDLKESIGDNIYFFASKKASLLTGFAPKIALPEIVAPITKKSLFEAGKISLEMCLAKEDERLTKRLILKFPKDINWDFGSPVAEEQKTKAWNYLHRILIKEVKPDIQACFT